MLNIMLEVGVIVYVIKKLLKVIMRNCWLVGMVVLNVVMNMSSVIMVSIVMVISWLCWWCVVIILVIIFYMKVFSVLYSIISVVCMVVWFGGVL